MMQNILANMAMAQAQEQQQQQRFAQQQNSQNFGRDHLGRQVNETQRRAWNDRLSKFRNERGAATSQDLFNNVEGRQAPLQGFAGGQVSPYIAGDQGQFGSNMPQGYNQTGPGGYFDPTQDNWKGYVGTNIGEFAKNMEDRVRRGVASFGGLIGDKGYSLSPNNADASQGYVPGSYNGYDIANREGLNAGFTGRGDRGDDRGDGFGGGYGDAEGHGNSRF